MKKKAFTLVEILTVCAIIMVLATVVMINLTQAQKKSRDTRRKADLSSIAAALEMYKAENKHYPVTSTPAGGSISGLVDLNPYFTVIPADPGSDSSLKYIYHTNLDGISGIEFKITAKSETITPPSGTGVTCSTAAIVSDAKLKAKEFYNPRIVGTADTTSCLLFQISSSTTALNDF